MQSISPDTILESSLKPQYTNCKFFECLAFGRKKKGKSCFSLLLLLDKIFHSDTIWVIWQLYTLSSNVAPFTPPLNCVGPFSQWPSFFPSFKKGHKSELIGFMVQVLRLSQHSVRKISMMGPGRIS